MGSPTGKYAAGVYGLFRLTDWNAGLNTSASPNAIADNECERLENFVLSEQGVLKKRPGLRRMTPEDIQANIVTEFGSDDQSTDTNIRGHLV